ncbi:hypothetical protein HYH02_005860 [Chlamydomonas schloesseri]|uniref:Uncharacterized protein n=1 Tax=Chlamydomonas schloesseri TaxID=2026947 RepID=A0A835WK75_9CHLO|nr:hypothetical protein HYH02_005860 [Chlamydomonas schloesseri]|eukprot:KAG2449112.1 hypothetical protein HYH02_005860 [Chlamydomonas schloesseri]
MERILSTAQACISGYDVAFSRAVRVEERAWRRDDLSHRQFERVLLQEEANFLEEERRYLHTQIQQAHVENARSLWLRFVNRNRTEVMEKTEQLKAVSSLSALLAGFALVGFLEFQFVVSNQYNKALLPLFALTTSITVGVEVAAVVLTSLMLANILRTAKTYVNEQEEAEFMHRCQAFVANYRPGDRPPAPVRTFAVHWARRCEHEWRIAFRLFSTGIPFFFVNLALAGWIKFHDAQTPVAPIIVTLIMGSSLLYNLYTHRKWGEYLMADGSEDAQEAGHQLIQPPVGLPFDWYLPPIAGTGGLELRLRPLAASGAGAPNIALAAGNAAGEGSLVDHGVGPLPAADGRQSDGEQVARGASELHVSVASCGSGFHRPAAVFRANGVT